MNSQRTCTYRRPMPSPKLR